MANNLKPRGFNVPRTALVTGGNGFVGQRLVEMLIARGSQRVISFDISPKPADALTVPQVEYIQGDLTKKEELIPLFKDIECVFHLAALVGPYHAKDKYVKVNYEGCQLILEACKIHGVKRIVMSSSPSTRFPYPDPNVNGYTEEELGRINGGDFAPKFLQPYAETKAQGEKLIRDACGSRDDDLLTIAVAPHQVYGPRDSLFLPNLLETAGNGSLRIFGDGENLISFCHVDNYCHGLILGYEALYAGSPALGKFYIVTDEQPQKFWRVLDEAVVEMGFTSLWSKFHLPTWFMMTIAYLTVFVGNVYSFFTGTPEHVVNYHLKLNPFAVKMLVINRYFNIRAAAKDLHYVPIITFREGWDQTIQWFKANWLPKYRNAHSSQDKKHK